MKETEIEKVRRFKKLLIKGIPEDAETTARIFDRMEADMAAGLIIDTPRTYKDCHSWREAWAYIFHRGWSAEGHHLKLEGDKVTCAVWVGLEFTDKLVVALEKIASRIGVNNDLIEMRLVGTRVTSKGAEKLKKILPKAIISFYTREETKKDPQISRLD
jgi:hypothetical protein